MLRWDENPLKLITMIALIIGLILVTFASCNELIIKPVKEASEMNDARDAVHIGTVIDKEIINAERGFFTSSDKRYQIVISIEYEYEGETFTDEKEIDVDENVYLSYNVGDLFDTHNPVPKQDDSSTISEEVK